MVQTLFPGVAPFIKMIGPQFIQFMFSSHSLMSMQIRFHVFPGSHNRHIKEPPWLALENIAQDCYLSLQQLCLDFCQRNGITYHYAPSRT